MIFRKAKSRIFGLYFFFGTGRGSTIPAVGSVTKPAIFSGPDSIGGPLYHRDLAYARGIMAFFWTCPNRLLQSCAMADSSKTEGVFLVVLEGTDGNSTYAKFMKGQDQRDVAERAFAGLSNEMRESVEMTICDHIDVGSMPSPLASIVNQVLNSESVSPAVWQILIGMYVQGVVNGRREHIQGLVGIRGMLSPNPPPQN
jgi:hypothetical protein